MNAVIASKEYSMELPSYSISYVTSTPGGHTQIVMMISMMKYLNSFILYIFTTVKNYLLTFII
jgi:hypothetical protein